MPVRRNPVVASGVAAVLEFDRAAATQPHRNDAGEARRETRAT
jgi:hypothetical protein